jgi:hypothetical protein
LCSTSLRQGCYTVSFIPAPPAGRPILGTRYRGTLRVEQRDSGLRFSGDLYRYRLIDVIATDPRPVLLAADFQRELVLPSNEAADTGGVIPIYRRRDYHSYLRGTAAQLSSIVPVGAPCMFTLDFEEFVYNQPATGFSGSFNRTATRSIRFVLAATATPDLYTGDAYEGATRLGTVSIRWVSPNYRRAHLQVNTLQGAVTPPADVGGPPSRRSLRMPAGS